MSLNAFFKLLPFSLEMSYSDVNDFWILIVGGYISVGLAIVLYTFGVYFPYKNRFEAVPKDDEDFPADDGGSTIFFVDSRRMLRVKQVEGRTRTLR
eukprot:scaffold22274_cov69-Cylindrotheca_fusiformis.AAC.1